MKSIYRLIFVSSITIGFIYPGCGSCKVNKEKSVLPNGDFITKVNRDGIHSKWSSTHFLRDVQFWNKRKDL